MRSSGLAWLLGLFTLCSLSGCDKGPKKVIPDKSVPVTGMITIEGKPLGNARVTFFPTEAPQGDGAASGYTDSAGKYELRAMFGDKMVTGAAPGRYKVSVSKMLRPDGTTVPPESKEPPIMSGARESIAIEYSAWDRTEQTATVSSSGGTFDFDVKPQK